MFSRLILTISILGSALFAADAVTSPAAISSRNASTRPVASFAPSTASATSAPQKPVMKETADRPVLYSQVVPATACVTPLGACPLVQFVPVGYSCVCYTVNGPIAGTAVR
jgi:hypothetical protein